MVLAAAGLQESGITEDDTLRATSDEFAATTSTTHQTSFPCIRKPILEIYKH